MRKVALLLMLALSTASCRTENPTPEPSEEQAAALQLPSATVVDLTHGFDETTIFWPTAEGFVREPTAEGLTEQGYWYAAGRVHFAEHGGTHLDAPIHFARDRQAVDEIPLDRLVGSAVVVDVSDQVADNPDYQISVGDLEAWESDHRPIPDGSILIFRTGYGRFWPDRARYLGTTAQGERALREMHFPGLSPEAAQWIVSNRNVTAVGIDTPSIDYGQSQEFRTHRILLEEEIPVFENVANVDELPVSGSIVVALPMKITGGSGAPLRIIAFVP